MHSDETDRNHPEASNADRADHNQSAPDGKAALNAMDDHQRQAGGVNGSEILAQYRRMQAILDRIPLLRSA